MSLFEGQLLKRYTCQLMVGVSWLGLWCLILAAKGFAREEIINMTLYKFHSYCSL